MTSTHDRPTVWASVPFCFAAAVISASLSFVPGAAHAAEGGATVYLLGSGTPGTAIMPPLEGIYYSMPVYLYEGDASASRQFVVNGRVVADLNANVAATFPALLWVPTTNFLGGTLALGAVMPVGYPDVTASANVIGPGGGQVTRRLHDDSWVVGDPLVTAMLGWKAGNLNIQASTLINIPVGDYREGELANLAFNRWAEDVSLALSWRDDKSGWDITGKAGVTFNGKNDVTDYNSGNDFHAEGSISKKFGKVFSLGVQSYYYKQISGDSGPSARLGAFKGEVVGVGGTAAIDVMMGKTPTTMRVQYLQEFDATNRLEGKSVWFTLSLPLWMKMPPQAQ